MAFDASVLPNVLINLDNMLADTRATNAERNFPTAGLQALTASQQVQVQEQLQNNQCVALDAYFLEVGAHLAPAAIPDAATQGCDLVAGNEAATRKGTYNTSRIGFASFTVTGPKCNNAVQMAEEMAVLMLKGQNDIRKQVQKAYYTLLSANVQANQDTLDTTFGASIAGGNRLKVDPALWNFELLRRMNLLADRNFFPENHIYLSGSNLFLDKDLAMYRQLNDDQRDQAAIFGDSQIVFDTRMMDQHLGRQSTIIVNPAQLIFYNTAFWPTTGVDDVVGGKKRTMYTINDLAGWTYRVGNETRTVQYHVEVEETCTGRNSLGELIKSYVVNVQLLGTLNIAPTGFNNPIDVATAPTAALTGILEIVNEA